MAYASIFKTGPDILQNEDTADQQHPYDGKEFPTNSYHSSMVNDLPLLKLPAYLKRNKR